MKMKVIAAHKLISQYDRQGFTVWSLSDLRATIPEKHATFRKTLERLCREGILARVSRSVYLYLLTGRDRHVVFGEIIASLRQGEYCFESLETAASAWGIIPQTPLGAITVMTTGRSGHVATPFGSVEFVHTDAAVGEILANTVPRNDFIPLATAAYTVHGLRRCGRTTELDEAIARGDFGEDLTWQRTI